MEFRCPRCGGEFSADPWKILGDTQCPLCKQPIYVEVDEGGEGPLFTVYQEMPGCELFPPKNDQ